MRAGKLGWNMKWVAGVAAKVLFTECVHFYNLTWPVVQPGQVREEEKNQYILDLFIRVNISKRAIISLKLQANKCF